MIIPNEDIFPYYFYFMQERMNIFWNKYDQIQPLTNDMILEINKFTNVYRAMDRVSQYLIRNVIYTNESYSDEDILFRIIIFKIFNKIETWEFFESEFGEISISNFDLNKYSQLLSKLKSQQPIFNNAYMMTGTHSLYNHLNFKHEKWLSMVSNELIGDDIFKQIIDADSLSSVFHLLRNCSFIGDFLAYQYAIDMNYSPVIDFDENSYVKAGIGAIRGIKKCFKTLPKNYTSEDAIRFTQENLESYREKYGFDDFNNLFGREPTLIDLQNCFCETDKYLRAKIPELQIDNKRIKQKYKETQQNLNLFFPPKWNINQKIDKPCISPNTKELTLF